MLDNMDIENELDIIESDLAHELQKYLELKEGLYAIGFYTKDMDEDSINKSILELLTRKSRKKAIKLLMGVASWMK